MKHFSLCPYADMEMKPDPVLETLLADLVESEDIRNVIETGTYRGLGSTSTLGRIFAKRDCPVTIYTVEGNLDSYRQAKRNLAKWPFIRPMWGTTIHPAVAIELITSDEALNHQDTYPDIYIDHTEDAIQKYIAESSGPTSDQIDSYYEEWQGHGLLGDLLEDYLISEPLIILDSAGGLGWAEFMTVLIRAGNRYKFHLLLDDVEHVKHFRSLRYIRSAPGWRLHGTQRGWALATFNPVHL